MQRGQSNAESARLASLVEYGAADVAADNRRESSPAEQSAPEILAGNAGDHTLVYELLRAVNHRRSAEDFASWLDDPSYEPTDRLIVRHTGRVVAHVYVLHRAGWFAGVKLPVAGLLDMALLPEYRLAGYQRLLLIAAEGAMREDGAVVSLMRTEQPDMFAPAGWREVITQGYSQANTRDILAHLVGQPKPRRWRARPQLKVRLWRHVEIDALGPIYNKMRSDAWGLVHRSEPYWQWLVGRGAHDELIVAIDGPDAPDEQCGSTNIVGYAVVQGPRVVEVCCLPGYEHAAPLMLARACQDAIERDLHTVSLHTPASDPLHELLVTAGGSWRGEEDGVEGCWMVKLLDHGRWIESIYPILQARAKACDIPRPCEIGFEIGHQRYRFTLTRRSSRIVADRAAHADVLCDAATFSDLLVGNLDTARACEEGQLVASDERTRQRLIAIFPPQLFWQSPFDLLRI